MDSDKEENFKNHLIDKIIIPLLNGEKKDICTTLNDYFQKNPEIRQLLDSDDNKCKEFMSQVLKLNYGMTSVLERIRHVKQVKRERDYDEHGQQKKIKMEPVNYWVEEYLHD